ncbi:unnamed protein product [Cuscuta europaea]|uniref:VQ domain-containing protein n=1 Tax=Cuscuta europaea TaxID=41803 RepID=A0A9P0Z795_CUSEU|nr:unnamed protein product [Cuscuta europaea]
MALSETMPVGPSDWAQFYQHSLTPACQEPMTNLFGGDARVSDATVVTTTVTSPTAPHSLGGRLSPEGRVSKPAVRRRTRASRRTPTTVLNTDASNFRAMVQQFTGGPSLAAQQAGHYPFLHPGSGMNFGFGLGSSIPRHPQLLNPAPARANGGYQLQYQPSQSGHFMFAASPNNGNMSGVGISSSDDLLPGGLSFPANSHRGSSSSSSAGNETNNYMF